MKNFDLESGRASWEEPKLSFFNNIRKHWRQFLIHLWGPAGSLVFHVIAIGVLVTFATSSSSNYVDTNPVEIVANAKPEDLDKDIPIEKPIQQKQEEIKEISQEESGGFSLTPTDQPIGGAGDLTEGTGIGTSSSDNLNKGFEIDITVKSRLVLKGLNHSRTSSGRNGALKKWGGNGGASSTSTEEAVLKALRWLKKEQQSDGSWKGDKQNAPPAMTALALLTFLAHGEIPATSKEFGLTVKKAIEWLITNQNANGHFNGKDGNDYSQPIAAYALCEAYSLIQHPDIKQAAIKAVSEIIKGQNANGNFGYKLIPSDRDDTSYMGWCCQALKAANIAQFEYDLPGLDPAIKKAIAGFKLNASADGGFGYIEQGKTGLSGAGVLCLQILGNPQASEVKKTMKFLEACTFSFANYNNQPYNGNSPLYYWYYITQAKFQHNADSFIAWNKQFSPELCKTQIIEKDAIEDIDGKKVDIGYWKSPSSGEHTGGTVQDTCLCALMLEVYYRYLPSFKYVEEKETIVKEKEDTNIRIK
jgi:hypothetical protein